MRKTQCFAIAAGLLLGSVSMFAQAKGDAAKGKDVFDQNCSVCHNSDSTDRKMGPGLKGVTKKAKLESNGKPATVANISAKIDEGGNGMPPSKDTLSAAEKNNLLAYLGTL